jgi:hypothetical protein
MINNQKKYCYRITHINNLALLLQHGIVHKSHQNANKNYIDIGNQEIIDVRNSTLVKLSNYGMIGQYIPFYFTPKSLMLFNIITGYWHPKVVKRNASEILILRCLISDLTTLPKWFFTDGQANDMASQHFNDLVDLDKIDWENIQNINFSKSDGDYDRPRRYQAEFLVHDRVPFEKIESINVFNSEVAKIVENVLNQNQTKLAVNIQPQYFF